MDNTNTAVSSADLQNNGLIISFADGTLAFYSAGLLHSIFSQAEELHGTDEDAENDRQPLRSRS